MKKFIAIVIAVAIPLCSAAAVYGADEEPGSFDAGTAAVMIGEGLRNAYEVSVIEQLAERVRRVEERPRPEQLVVLDHELLPIGRAEAQLMNPVAILEVVRVVLYYDSSHFLALSHQGQSEALESIYPSILQLAAGDESRPSSDALP